MPLIWIDQSELEKVRGFHALEHTEYKAVYQNKAAIKKFLELRLSAIRNGIVQSKNIKDEEIPIILKGLRIVETDIIPVLERMKEQIEEKDLHQVPTEYTGDTATQ